MLIITIAKLFPVSIDEIADTENIIKSAKRLIPVQVKASATPKYMP